MLQTVQKQSYLHDPEAHVYGRCLVSLMASFVTEHNSKEGAGDLLLCYQFVQIANE